MSGRTWAHAMRRERWMDRGVALVGILVFILGAVTLGLSDRASPRPDPGVRNGMSVTVLSSRADCDAIHPPVVPPPVLSPPPPLNLPKIAIPALHRYPMADAQPMSIPRIGMRSAAPVSVVAPVSSSASPIPTRGLQSASEESSAQDVIWQQAVLARLMRYRVYPDAARAAGEFGTTVLRLVLDRGGHVLSARVTDSSGTATLDAEALALAYRAAPYPRPPGSVPGAKIMLLVPVSFEMDGF